MQDLCHVMSSCSFSFLSSFSGAQRIWCSFFLAFSGFIDSTAWRVWQREEEWLAAKGPGPGVKPGSAAELWHTLPTELSGAPENMVLFKATRDSSGASSKKRKKKATCAGCIWWSLRIGTTYAWRCDEIGLQMWPPKDADPALRHSNRDQAGICSLGRSQARSQHLALTTLPDCQLLQEVISCIMVRAKREGS